jgi:hypothetical protein
VTDRLVRQPLRLTQSEVEAVNELKGDRPKNTCYRRAVQMWIRHERALADGKVTSIRPGDPVWAAVPGPNETPVRTEPEPEEDVVEPRTRRPPPGGTWGAGS